ncbi:MAG: ACP S-malonyltransferase, partial [Oscillospiraceae bacterium]|nr:ACP S-malonyltransferase [Oscillospiraceae bacterium]
AVCAETDGYVVPVNYNSAAQTVIAGETSAAEKAAARFAEMGAKAVKLGVSSAFHSKLMQPAAEDFEAALRELNPVFNKPSVSFFSNLTGAAQTDFDDMPAKLAKHIVSPVKFTSELNALAEEGYTNFVELGPNKVLTGLVKKTLKGVNAVNVENSKTLEKALELLK